MVIFDFHLVKVESQGIAYTHVRMCAWQPILHEPCNFKRFFLPFFFSFFPSSSALHIGNPGCLPRLLKRALQRSSLLYQLLIWFSIALGPVAINIYKKLSTNVIL